MTVEMDERLAQFRRGTPFDHVRPSDAKLLVIASRQRRTLSELGRVVGVTRQAIHLAVQRLAKLGLIALQPVPSDKRENTIIITPHGHEAIRMAEKQVRALEDEIASLIGTDGVETLRSTTHVLVGHLARLRATGSLTPQG
ncbi:MAG: MarR family transcriptional regulator [Hyphomicrobiales bacterium]